jgi:hypothetical protein
MFNTFPNSKLWQIIIQYLAKLKIMAKLVFDTLPIQNFWQNI